MRHRSWKHSCARLARRRRQYLGLGDDNAPLRLGQESAERIADLDQAGSGRAAIEDDIEPVAVYEALRQKRLSISAFAVSMGVPEDEVHKLLNPAHATKIGRLEEALARFGKRLVVTVEEAA